MLAQSLRLTQLRRPSVRVLLIVVIAAVSLLYIEWRSTRVAPSAAEQDTMCIAARIGLSCR